MSKNETVGISGRFDLADEDERRAWKYLKGIGKSITRSATSVSIAVMLAAPKPSASGQRKESALLGAYMQGVRKGVFLKANRRAVLL